MESPIDSVLYRLPDEDSLCKRSSFLQGWFNWIFILRQAAWFKSINYEAIRNIDSQFMGEYDLHGANWPILTACRRY